MNAIFPDALDDLPVPFAPGPLSGVLFVEDFDEPPSGVIESMPEPEAPVIVPSFTADDMDAARRDGYEAGLREARAATEAARAGDRLAALERIGAGLADASIAAASAAETAAEGVATLMLRMLSRMLPALSAAFGEQEVRALVRSLLPALASEPEAAIRVHPQHLAGVTEELAGLDVSGAPRIELSAMPSLPLGDARITWQAGGARRDAAAIRAAIDQALDSLGLLAPLPANPMPVPDKRPAAPVPATLMAANKEIEHVG